MTSLPHHLLPLHQQLEAMRPALLQLRNPALAKDAAQDALIAALEQKDFFRGMAWRLEKFSANTTRIFLLCKLHILASHADERRQS